MELLNTVHSILYSPSACLYHSRDVNDELQLYFFLDKTCEYLKIK